MAILPPDPVYIMRGDMGPVHSLLFRVSPYIEHLYAGAESGRIHIWDLRRNREIFKLDASNEPCLAMHTMSDECLVTQRKGGAINLWQPQSSSWVISETVETDYSGFCRAQVSTEDELFIPLNDSKIGLFSLKTLKTEIELNPLSLPDAKSLGMIMAIKPYIDESKYVLVAYDGGLVYMWDMRTKKMLSSLEVEQCPMAIDFSPTLMTGIVGSPCNNLQVFTLSNGNELSEKTRLPLKNPGISAIAIRPDAKTFATGGWDSRIRIYSWKTLRPLVVLDQPHRATIHDIVYSSCKVEAYNSKCLMAAAGKDGNISLWDLYN